ncbi:MAG: thiamine pyrophosphate-dependent enzyme [Flammeovirgaceae bacterium]|nr:thiamine pyrophosphate-dependent enzyme [Flammeovirgaceae bacterium]
METITYRTFTKEEVLSDYRLALESRHASLIGRKEVFMGKAKFGIFGDGKEVPQLAMAKVFQKGDFRSGYYRDQTFMMAIGELTLEAFFAQLYAHTDIEHDPATGGRCMNAHFGNRLLDNHGNWKVQTQMKNSVTDISCTAGQMPRLVGLAYASKLYRQNPSLATMTDFSINGNEVAFGTIGNASCAEGHFWEALNAAGVLKIPMLVSIWDDGYGISVPNEYQIAKNDIYTLLAGFQRKNGESGFELYQVKAWDYEALCEVYQQATDICRREHVPVVIHVVEVTQPQGHSTSGSHERYKSKERLAWEKEHDCIAKMRQWLLANDYASPQELDEIEFEAIERVKKARKNAWDAFVNSMKGDHMEALAIIGELAQHSAHADELLQLQKELEKTLNPLRLDAVKAMKKAARLVRLENNPAKKRLSAWIERTRQENERRYSSHLYSESMYSALRVKENPPVYAADSPMVDGREIMQACFDAILARDPRVFAIGEDVGRIGDVNQGFAGLQAKYGELRVTDTGIREATILGQGIGAAIRGLRPIVEIQYLDYIFYALQSMTDDLACLHYRSAGGQKAPLIIRTRGHRLEGIWHSGSPMGAILNSIRGIYLMVPRNMTKAAGFYNTMLQSDDPGLIIECLNGYRLKERMPLNIGEITVPLGIPEILKEGNDVTIVTYGSMCRIVMEAVEALTEVGIDCEVIDVQTLLPFDIEHRIARSVRKTNRLLITDEDVSGGATGYMLAKIMEQDVFRWLDSPPITLSAKDHRPAYASDGDYFSKPNPEDIFDAVYKMMNETNPLRFPLLY